MHVLTKLLSTVTVATTLAYAAGPGAASPATPAQIDARQLNTWFEDAGREFKVPALLLKSIAFNETRWTQVWRPEADEHPPLFTIMGLRDDDWFGHSLRIAAAKIGVAPESLKNDVHQSIRAGAAYLASLHQASDSPESRSSDLLGWIQDVKRYSGIPSDRDANLGAAHVFTQAGEGFTVIEDQLSLPIDGTGQELPLSLMDSSVRVDNGDEAQLGIPFEPSPNIDVDAIDPKAIIIHDTEGAFAGAVSWLKNPSAKVSAHFVLRSSDGYGKQLVHESDRAWHVRCWNPYAIGIEHEGWESKPQYFTDTMMRSSAKLVRTLARKYDIPVDDTHIVGHNFWKSPKFSGSVLDKLAGKCNDHTDPGKFWDWAKFFRLING